MVAVAVGDAKVRAKEELARVRVSLAGLAEVEATRLEVERTSLMLDIGAAKDEVSSLQSQAGKE